MSQRHNSKPKGPGDAATPASADAAALQADHAALQDHLAALSGERDRAYRALAMREADLARIQRIAGIGGVEVDLTRRLQELPLAGISRDPRARAGHARPKATTAGCRASIPTIASACGKYFVDTIRGDGDDYATEYRIVRRDNGADALGRRARPHRARRTSGRATKLIGAHIDITDRKLAEESLARERGALPRHRQLLAGADVGDQPRRHARLRQSGLSRLLRPVAGGGGQARLAQRDPPRRPAARDARTGHSARHRRAPRQSRPAEAVRARDADPRRQQRMALGALGIAAALRRRRQAHRLHRRRLRRHAGQARRGRAARERGTLPPDHQLARRCRCG